MSLMEPINYRSSKCKKDSTQFKERISTAGLWMAADIFQRWQMQWREQMKKSIWRTGFCLLSFHLNVRNRTMRNGKYYQFLNEKL